jgi:glutamyl-tRNA synthetase
MLTRIAPTPSGFLHLGNAFNFLLTEKLAKKHGGKILLRIDDIDAERKRPEYIRDIFESLEWLEVEWQLGPRNPEEFESGWSQHLRIGKYNEALIRLWEHHQLYACSCSRKQLQEKNDCRCREKKIPIDAPDTALKLHVPSGTIIQFDDEHLGPQRIPLEDATGALVIRRRDGLPSYQLVSVVDDLHFGIDYIVRGADLLPSTAAQIFIARQLGAARFGELKFLHHVLLPDNHGQKLSKSEGAYSLKSMRANGMRKGDMLEQLAPLLKLEE